MSTANRNLEYSADLEHLTLEEVVERIKRRGPNAANIVAGSQNFDEKFLNGGVDQGMTSREWDEWWARFEGELDQLDREKFAQVGE